jgi:hypothetical protein
MMIEWPNGWSRRDLPVLWVPHALHGPPYSSVDPTFQIAVDTSKHVRIPRFPPIYGSHAIESHHIPAQEVVHLNLTGLLWFASYSVAVTEFFQNLSLGSMCSRPLSSSFVHFLSPRSFPLNFAHGEMGSELDTSLIGLSAYHRCRPLRACVFTR